MYIEHIKNMEYPAIREMMADLTKLDIPTRAELIKRLTQLEVVYSIDYIQKLLDNNVDVYNLAKREIDEYVGIHQYNRTISHFILRQNLDTWDEKDIEQYLRAQISEMTSKFDMAPSYNHENVDILIYFKDKLTDLIKEVEFEDIDFRLAFCDDALTFMIALYYCAHDKDFVLDAPRMTNFTQSLSMGSEEIEEMINWIKYENVKFKIKLTDMGIKEKIILYKSGLVKDIQIKPNEYESLQNLVDKETFSEIIKNNKKHSTQTRKII
jgi:hypothetical protein